MLDTMRTVLHRAITTPAGDFLPPVRVQKDLARRLNTLLGSPLCSKDDLAKRRAAALKLTDLRKSGAKDEKKREPAPVTVYFEKDRNARLLERMEEALKAKNVPYKLLDIAGDEATHAFVMRTAKCEADELPIVFVGSTPIGGYNELVAFDVSGELLKAVFGD